MKQISFAQAEHQNNKKVTRREVFPTRPGKCSRRDWSFLFSLVTVVLWVACSIRPHMKWRRP